MIERWFEGDVGEIEVRIWSDGRPQLWVPHGRGKDARKGRHAAHGRVKERRAPQQVLALVEERTGISVAQLVDWVPEAVIRRLARYRAPVGDRFACRVGVSGRPEIDREFAQGHLPSIYALDMHPALR